MLEFGASFAQTADSFEKMFNKHESWVTLYKDVVAKTKDDTRDDLYCVRYAAGVLFSDGSTKTAAQSKLVEYNFSADPITKLLLLLEDNRTKGIHPSLIIQCDQFGVCHAPFAPARGHLFEGEFKSTSVIVHDSTGKLVETSVANLLTDSIVSVIQDSLHILHRQSSMPVHTQ